MELIETKEYKGFKTEFFILPKTKKFLQEKNIKLSDFIPQTLEWYEKNSF